jgi:hypothetical protein
VLKLHADRQVPAEVREAVERAHHGVLAGLEGIASASRKVDASLPQLVESARAKVDYQFARPLRGSREQDPASRSSAAIPSGSGCVTICCPATDCRSGDWPSLELVAYRGAAAAGEVTELAAEHAERIAHGTYEHLVAEL